MGVCELLHAQDRTWHSARSLLALTLALAHAHKHTHTHTRVGKSVPEGCCCACVCETLTCTRSNMAICEIIARDVRDHCSRCCWFWLGSPHHTFFPISPNIYIYRERDKEMVIERGIGMEKYSEIMGGVYRDIEGF